jgi:hypothetical protein
VSDAGLTLRARLLELRRDVVGVLQRDDAAMGELALLASVQGALAAIDAEAVEAMPPATGDRALVVDDNMTVQIVVYSADRRTAVATLSPAAAIRLAGQLISPACRRL